MTLKPQGGAYDNDDKIDKATTYGKLFETAPADAAQNGFII